LLEKFINPLRKTHEKNALWDCSDPVWIQHGLYFGTGAVGYHAARIAAGRICRAAVRSWGIYRKRISWLFPLKGGYSGEKACRLDFNTRLCMGAHWLLQSQHGLHHPA